MSKTRKVIVHGPAPYIDENNNLWRYMIQTIEPMGGGGDDGRTPDFRKGAVSIVCRPTYLHLYVGERVE